MAILVGIDEAGYGPHLGPLVVAAAAMEFPGETLPDPDLWAALGQHVCKRPSGAGSRVLVCDSKVAYPGDGNVGPLERTVLGYLAATGARPLRLSDLLSAAAVRPTATAAADDPVPQPWEHPQALSLPASTPTEEIDAAAARLTEGLALLGGRALRLWVNVASAARLNRLMDASRNKARALFALTADLLAAAMDLRPSDPIHVTMDSHGGRRYYAGLLAGAFPMTPVETLSESAAVSRYRLVRDGPVPPGKAPVYLTICNRCETWSLATALASMAAKYVRELHMLQLNAYFGSLVPGLRPTAGYGRDAWRFLDEVADARALGRIEDAQILRSR